MLHKILSPFVLFAALFIHHSTFDRVSDHTMASIVRVTGTTTIQTFFGPFETTYTCTGFVVRPHVVLTAKHCLGTAMALDGNTKVGVLRMSDDSVDLALLSTESTKPALEFDPLPLHRGQEITGFGYGFGFTRILWTTGKVMLVDYAPPAEPGTDGEPVEQMTPGIWIDHGYHGGMSGGPVVNADGEVVGIVQRSGDGVGYGVGELVIRAFMLGI